jgi:hypothetical protein
LCFVSVSCCFNKFVNHGSRWGDTAQALARWRHPVAPSEALDVLYPEMLPMSYRPIRTAIEITSDSPAFFVVADSLLPTNIAK